MKVNGKSKLFSFIWKRLIKHRGTHDRRGKKKFLFFPLSLFTLSCLKDKNLANTGLLGNRGSEAPTRRGHPSFTQPSWPRPSVPSGLLHSSPWQNSNLDGPNAHKGTQLSRDPTVGSGPRRTRGAPV